MMKIFLLNISVSFHFFMKLVQELELLFFPSGHEREREAVIAKTLVPRLHWGDLHSFSLLVLGHFWLTFDHTDQSNNL